MIMTGPHRPTWSGQSLLKILFSGDSKLCQVDKAKHLRAGETILWFGALVALTEGTGSILGIYMAVYNQPYFSSRASTALDLGGHQAQKWYT